ncbi:TPA: iron ABC transporter permease, partial [Candidatus Poribacteria bacterium]|nr:iron ABC transporter permease [Candidatus Poribacteria bacterium]HEX29233.1 iron ABC transporter permease [Candidatus Poribacteria bacterium]
MKGSELYSRYRSRRIHLLVVISVALLLTILISLSLGAVSIGLKELLRILLGGGDEMERAIVWEMRMPRVTMAILGGACLALSGAAIQGILRNPLASPFTLG